MTTRLLHIASSILGTHSASRLLSAAIINRLQSLEPGLETTYRDLAAAPLPHLTPAFLPTAPSGETSPEDVPAERAESQAVLDEFLAANIVVIGAPMYNFTIPSQLKAWLDRILIAGKTFSYDANGPKGLAGDKQVIVAIARGGLYGTGTPMAAVEHVESYLKAVFGFIGVTRIEFVVAEGLQMGPEHRGKALDGALEAATRTSIAA